MSEPTEAERMLKVILNEIHAQTRRIEDQRGLKDSVIQIATELAKTHAMVAEILDRLQTVEGRVADLEGRP